MFGLVTVSCKESTNKDVTNKEATSSGEVSNDPAQIAEAQFKQGKMIYISRCIACHNADPKKQGSLGPDVWGSSKELLEARVVHGKYPEGYTPKKDSRIMVPMPELANDIEALHVFLNK
jgi:mono/diheme cytochrome c family protein